MCLVAEFSNFLGTLPAVTCSQKSNFKWGNIQLALLFSNIKIFFESTWSCDTGQEWGQSLQLRNKGWSKSIFLKELATEMIEDRKKHDSEQFGQVYHFLSNTLSPLFIIPKI